MSTNNTFKLFSGKELYKVIQDKTQNVEIEINSKSENYILNVNEIDFINYLVDKYSIKNINLKFNEKFISTYEKDVPLEQFPSLGFRRFGSSGVYKKNVIRFHIPYEGSEELLHFISSNRLIWTLDVLIENNCLCFDVVNFYDDSERIKNEASGNIHNIERQSNYVLVDVSAYNSTLFYSIKTLVEKRKQHFFKINNLLDSLGVPIRKAENFPKTFSIPSPQTSRKIKIPEPIVTEQGYKPDPTLEFSIYQEIVQTIHDVGRQFERMPSTYASKNEEDLRDHILLFLEPRFDGSATGETFNKTGKTDILLRYQNSNVFIAECKFWKGAKSFLRTITQLLGYLTWRDSKAAVVIFCQNQDFSSVIKIVEQEASKHPNFLDFVSKNEETWLNYRFHINGDRNREIKVAVLLFHIPHN